jgi:hypothetical protein
MLWQVFLFLDCDEIMQTHAKVRAMCKIESKNRWLLGIAYLAIMSKLVIASICYVYLYKINEPQALDKQQISKNRLICFGDAIQACVVRSRYFKRSVLD